MVQPFNVWIKTQNHPSLRRWANHLLDLGASWETFRRDPNLVVNDLVASGIPILAARSLVTIAMESLKRSIAPMSIFWDLESVTPMPQSARDIAIRLKSLLEPHGTLVQFRGYGSMTINNDQLLLPEEDRIGLQLCNCQLIDCRKNVVDKTIIVDSMQFAYTHREATLCFIAGNADYANLLTVLKQLHCRIILISHVYGNTALHTGCNLRLNWDSHVLQNQRVSIPPGFGPPQPQRPGGGSASSSSAAPPPSLLFQQIQQQHHNDNDNWKNKDLVVHKQEPPPKVNNEMNWKKNVGLLQQAIRGAPSSSGGLGGTSALKSYVGNFLREKDPIQFDSRDTVKEFLFNVIEKGIVTETGQGPYKTLTLASYQPKMVVSDRSPIPREQMPQRSMQVVQSCPFIIFVNWSDRPQKFSHPEKAFVQAMGKWAIFMFRTLTDALSAIEADPWLHLGRLVDWRLVKHDQPAESVGATNTCSATNNNNSVKTISSSRRNNYRGPPSDHEKGGELKTNQGVVLDSIEGFWAEQDFL